MAKLYAVGGDLQVSDILEIPVNAVEQCRDGFCLDADVAGGAGDMKTVAFGVRRAQLKLKLGREAWQQSLENFFCRTRRSLGDCGKAAQYEEKTGAVQRFHRISISLRTLLSGREGMRCECLARLRLFGL